MEHEQPLPPSARLEAVLYAAAEPLRCETLADTLGMRGDELETVIDELEHTLRGRGLMLTRQGNRIALVTHPAAAADVRTVLQQELTGDLGQAGRETLAVILYRGPVSKRAIDYIRGVNCASVLRNLLVRGLIEKKGRGRSAVYRATFDTLSHLGVSSVEELPRYHEMCQEIETHEQYSTNTI